MSFPHVTRPPHPFFIFNFFFPILLTTNQDNGSLWKQLKWDNRLLKVFPSGFAIAWVRRDKPITSDGIYLAKTLLKKMVVSSRQFSHHSVLQRNYLWKNVCRRTIYTSERLRIAQFQDSALQNAKILSSCHINPPPLPPPPLPRQKLTKKYIFILWGCARATRSLHDEVPGIWFSSWSVILLWLLLTHPTQSLLF